MPTWPCMHAANCHNNQQSVPSSTPGPVWDRLSTLCLAHFVQHITATAAVVTSLAHCHLHSKKGGLVPLIQLVHANQPPVADKSICFLLEVVTSNSLRQSPAQPPHQHLPVLCQVANGSMYSSYNICLYGNTAEQGCILCMNFNYAFECSHIQPCLLYSRLYYS